MLNSAIIGVEYYLPPTLLTNEDLATAFPEWSVDKIEAKTGIRQRHIADKETCASDLGFEAALKLFNSGVCSPSEVDYILFCTQSPDYVLPTTACILQDRLGISTSAGALDFNLGCSGYVYGLSLAHGLIATQQAKNILFITAETYSKYIREDDRINRTIFSDGASATLISAVDSNQPCIGPFVMGSDGRGAKNLIVEHSGARGRVSDIKEISTLSMNGPEIFSFTLNRVPEMIEALYQKAKMIPDDVHYYIFHQANAYMLEHLRKRLEIREERMPMFLQNVGNTVSSTIPILLSEGLKSGQFKSGMILMLIGFGVGYSWGATFIKIP